MSSIRLSRRTALGAALALPALPALGQSFPDRTVRVVVPYSAGGGTDVVAREIVRHMADHLKQTVIVENRTGGNTAIGANHVAGSPPDGYTLYFAGASSLVVPPLVTPQIGIRPEAFAPVSLVLKQAYGLGVHPPLAGSVQDLVGKLRAEPDKHGFGHTGTGGIGHLIGERLMAATGTRMVSVAYRGFQQTVLDVISGRLAMTFEATANFLPFLADGRVRLLAVTSDRRLPQLPNVPTFAEAGYPDLVVQSWLAVYAPAGTPAPVIARLNEAVVHAVRQPSFQDMAARQLQTPEPGTPEALAELMRSDIAAWRRVIEPLNLQVAN